MSEEKFQSSSQTFDLELAIEHTFLAANAVDDTRDVEELCLYLLQ